MSDSDDDFADPAELVSEEALAAWAAGDVGFGGAGVSDLLRKRIAEGWFEALPDAVSRLMRDWGFEWTEAPDIDEGDRPNLALLATDAVRGGYLIGRMALGTTASNYDEHLDDDTVDDLLIAVSDMDISTVAEIGGPSIAVAIHELIDALLAAYGNSDEFADIAYMAADSALAFALLEFDRVN